MARRGFLRWLAAQCMRLTQGLADRAYGERKRALLGPLRGDILEIGPGAGANLPYLQPDVHWIGVEPNVHMHPPLRDKARRCGLQADLRIGVAEHLEVPDGSVDAVVSTLVLCSVDDVAATLKDVLRVLRPGGRFVFIEHVAAPAGTKLRRVQEVVAPAWKAFADGCHVNRETWLAIERAGFSTVSYERFRIKTPLPIVAPHIAGVATKGSSP